MTSYTLEIDGEPMKFVGASNEEEARAMWEAVNNPPVSSEDINRERDKRIASFPFNGVIYDYDEISAGRIDKARGSALAALIAAGADADALVGNLRWADPDQDFGWVAKDNSFNVMDALTTLAFGNAAAAWEGQHILAARSLKNMNPKPTNYQNDQHWPSA